MDRKRAPARGIQLLAVAMVAVAFSGGIQGRPADGAVRWEHGEVLTRGTAPVRVLWTEMVARSASPQTDPQADPQLTPHAGALEYSGFGLADQAAQFQGNFAFPPDTAGAMGPNYFVEMLNGSVAIFTRGGSVVAANTTTLTRFFTFTNNGVQYPRNGAVQPAVLYDRHSGHWFAACVEQGDTPGADNDVLLAVSTGARGDPTDAWDLYDIPIGEPTGGGGTIPYTTLFPSLGVDDNGVYVGVRIHAGTGDFAKIAATPKAPLIAGIPSLGTVTLFTQIQDLGHTPQPATNFDAVTGAGPAWIFADDPGGAGGLRYRMISWSAGAPSLSAPAGTLPGPAYAALATAQANGSNPGIDLTSARLSAAIIRSSRLWVARTVGVNSAGTAANADRAACEWFEVDVSNPANVTLHQSGRVFDSAAAQPKFYYYPSVTIDGTGRAALGFSGSGAGTNGFVGAYTCWRLASDPLGTMNPPVDVQPGLGAYTRTDVNGLNRWGDASSTTLDPDDDMTAWTVQEYSEAPDPGLGSLWGTWIQGIPAPPPALNPLSGSAVAGTNGVVLQLTGQGFYDPGPGFPNHLQVLLIGGQTNGITNVTAAYNNSTSVTVTFDVAASASAGARSIILINPDGQSTPPVPGFTVLPASPNTIQFSSTSYSVVEGSTATVTVNRTGTLTSPASVTYATSDGTGIAGQDYSPASGTLNFAAGAAAASFTVAAPENHFLEPNKTVNLTLNAPSGTGTSLGAPDAAILSVAEDAATTAPSNLTASVTGSGVQLQWQDNCANEDGFQIQRATAASGPFSPIGTTGANVTTFDDAGVTAGISYFYQVRAFQGDSLFSDFSNTAIATVFTAQFNASTYAVTETGGEATITVTVSGSPSGTVSVAYTTSDGSASAANDYIPTAGTLSFAPGTLSATFQIPIIDNQLLEGDHSLNLTLSDPSGTGLLLGATSTAVLTISDDFAKPAPTNLTSVAMAGEIQLNWTNNCANADGFQVERETQGGSFVLIESTGPNAQSFLDSTAPQGQVLTYQVRAFRGTTLFSDYSNQATAGGAILQFSNAGYAVGAAAGSATITVARSGDMSGTVSASYATSDGTATSPTDYTPASGTVTFGPGVISASFNVAVVDNLLIEPAQSVNLTLSSPSTGAELGSQTAAILTIMDDPAGTAPENLTASVTDGSSISLAWTNRCRNQTGVEIQRKLGSGDFGLVATASASAVSYTDTTVTSGNTYIYEVRAINAQGASEFSNPVTVTVPLPPAAPGNVTATVQTINSILIAWQDTDPSVTSFRVERSSPAAGFAPVGTTGAGTFSYPDSTAVAGVAFTYRVFATNAAGDSPASASVTATIVGGGVLKVTPLKLNFGTVKHGKTKKLTVQIVNTGKGTLQGTVGIPGQPFAVSAGGAPFSLAKGKSAKVTVTFAPGVAGSDTAALNLTSTDPNHSQFSVPITGKGK